jgi:hypothetical protein
MAFHGNPVLDALFAGGQPGGAAPPGTTTDQGSLPPDQQAAPLPPGGQSDLDPQEALGIAIDTLHDLLTVIPDPKIVQMVTQALLLLTKAQTMMSEGG